VNSATEWSHPSIGLPFIPDTFIDIEYFREQLLAACRCYGEELRADPHPRSIRAMEIAVERRGREVGLKAAEAFMTLRRVIDWKLPGE
jgi:hypothetical protein